MSFQISVIIPTYNCENSINRAINSVINQTIGFEEIEIIIVDNKSTDSTRDIINEYASKYDNIIPIFLKKNSGSPSSSRNIGIETAKSDYVMFLDSDDEYDLKICDKLFNSISGDETLDFVCCGFQEESKDLNFNYGSSNFVKLENNIKLLNNLSKKK
ncbi:MAG: glycosyltransferase [Methanobrevibacter sp.]|jgi:glycosyltransferase involved in cell wall biosynthesis|nr:glycosyltransferase [Candidatus Methanovirga aequatorialis]